MLESFEILENLENLVLRISSLNVWNV